MTCRIQNMSWLTGQKSGSVDGFTTARCRVDILVSRLILFITRRHRGRVSNCLRLTDYCFPAAIFLSWPAAWNKFGSGQLCDFHLCRMNAVPGVCDSLVWRGWAFVVCSLMSLSGFAKCQPCFKIHWHLYKASLSQFFFSIIVHYATVLCDSTFTNWPSGIVGIKQMEINYKTPGRHIGFSKTA